MAGVASAIDGFQNTAGAFIFAGLHVFGAVALGGAGCADFPGDLVTCAPSLYGSGVLGASALVLTGAGIYEAKDEMIPGIKQAVTCKK